MRASTQRRGSTTITAGACSSYGRNVHGNKKQKKKKGGSVLPTAIRRILPGLPFCSTARRSEQQGESRSPRLEHLRSANSGGARAFCSAAESFTELPAVLRPMPFGGVLWRRRGQSAAQFVKAIVMISLIRCRFAWDFRRTGSQSHRRRSSFT